MRLALALLLLAAPAVAQQPPPPSQTPVLPDPNAAPPAPPPPAWLPRGSADIQALDKVNARSAALHVRVGEAAKFGALTIQVRACMVRPPDQPQDSAALMTIADAHPDQPGFVGWMLQSAPEVSMLEHPVYDVRVTGCGA